MNRNEFLKILQLDGCFILISMEGSVQEMQEKDESNKGIEVSSLDNINTTAVESDGL